MAQVFPRRSNLIARGTLIGVTVGLIVLVSAYWVYLRSPVFTGVGQSVPQPVPFSHQLHAGTMGIDCRYCHTTVETSPFAGMPDTKTCMNCHSVVKTDSALLAPIRASYQTGKAMQWTTVNNLPDYVFFNHSIHINKGIGCSSCHGDVANDATMVKAQSLQMGFCINCHMHPEQQIRPQSEVFNMSWQPPANQAEIGAALVQQYHVQSQLSCSTCHR
jgi:hypothetical protein